MSARNKERLRARRQAASAIAAAAVAAFIVTSASSASAQTGPVTGWSTGLNHFVYFNQANVDVLGASAVTFASSRSIPTPNQYAVAKAQLLDEWGVYCVGPQVFSSYPNGAASTSCHINHTSFASQGIVWGWTGTQWRKQTTYRLWYDRFAGARMAAPLVETPEWPVNAAGQTYGNGALAASADEYPDLITATATNGQRGYVVNADLNEASGESVLARGASPDSISAWVEGAAGVDRTIPVYDSDTTTVLGEFLIPAAEVAE
jgi:hypothetical protein